MAKRNRCSWHCLHPLSCLIHQALDNDWYFTKCAWNESWEWSRGHIQVWIHAVNYTWNLMLLGPQRWIHSCKAKGWLQRSFVPGFDRTPQRRCWPAWRNLIALMGKWERRQNMASGGEQLRKKPQNCQSGRICAKQHWFTIVKRDKWNAIPLFTLWGS